MVLCSVAYDVPCMGEQTDLDSKFADDVEIMENATVLEEDWTPNRLICRGDLVEQYRSVFKPIYKGRPPQSAFLYGDTGVGKTAATRLLLEELQDDIAEKNRVVDDDEKVNFDIVWINCQNNTKPHSEETSSYQIAIAIINSLRDKGNKISGTGYAAQDIYDIMYDELKELGERILIVLDEVDRIKDDDTLLYDLPRARDNGYVDNARIGVIGISNDYTYRKNLSPKVKDSLCETEFKFPAYDAIELKEILKSRSENALHEDTYDEEALAKCSALAYQEASGSARRAIRLLRRSAEVAEEAGSPTIEDTHIQQADKDLEYGNIVESVANQDDEKLYVLKALAHLEKADLTPARTKTIHDAYCRVVNEYNEYSGQEPLTQRGMFNHLSKLVMFGFVNTIEHNEGNVGGQWNEHAFSDDTDPEKIKEAYRANDLDWKGISLRGLG